MFLCIHFYQQDKVDDEIASTSSSVSPGTQLVRKLVSVLEGAEKLPLYVYDIPGAGSGLQVLSRRLRFRLERAPGESSLIDRNGRTLKVLVGIFFLLLYCITFIIISLYHSPAGPRPLLDVSVHNFFASNF